MLTEAIVLRTYPAGDKDIVIRVLSPDLGKISVFGKALRSNKKKAVLLEPLDLGLLELNERKGDLYSFRSFKPTSSFPLIRSSLNKLSLAASMCETLDLILPEDSGSDDTLFPRLQEALNLLAIAKELGEELKVAFFFIQKTLFHSGFVSNETNTPSVNNFKKLLKTIELISERKMLSKSTVYDTLRIFSERQSQQV